MSTIATTKCLAFLLCNKATRAADGKVSLIGIFDRMVKPPPRDSAARRIFYVFYKVFVGQPCKLELRVFDPLDKQVRGTWSDDLGVGLMQTIWVLSTNQFERPGKYTLELRQVSSDLGEVTLATTELVVDEPGQLMTLAPCKGG